MITAISPETTRIGWVGTGVMGASMCGHLMRAGYATTVYTRTPARAQDLVANGATWANTAKEVAARTDVVFAIVGDPSDVRAVFLGEDGILAGVQPGAVVVDMTTSEPSLAVEIARTAVLRGAVALDAPVSGGDVGAREARLSIMVGGDEATTHHLAPLWQCMGRIYVHQGPAGSGQHTKMVNQTLIATAMIGVCEGLLYGYKAGLDLDKVLQSVVSGAAGSWSLTNYAPRVLQGNFDPGFYVEHFIKDMGIALAEARKMNLALPGLALAQQLYMAVAAQGHGKKGTHALALALAAMSNINWLDRDAP